MSWNSGYGRYGNSGWGWQRQGWNSSPYGGSWQNGKGPWDNSGGKGEGKDHQISLSDALDRIQSGAREQQALALLAQTPLGSVTPWHHAELQQAQLL